MLRLSPVLIGACVFLLFPLGSSGRVAAEHTWSGTWSTEFGTLTLKQTGNQVEGNYTYDQGHLTGTVTGDQLSGRWDEAPTRTGPVDAGPYELTMGASGKSFTGKWRHDRDGSWYGSWDGTCTSGECARNGETEPSIDFNFVANAWHPKNIRNPLGRNYRWHTAARGWITQSKRHLAWTDYAEWGYSVEGGREVQFRIVSKQLRTSGPAKVLKLVGVLEQQEVLRPGDPKDAPRCHDGTRATFVLIDDDRLLPGGEKARKQTRDQVIVSLNRCTYFAHTYTNADSHKHDHFVGGQGSPRGGQWAIVEISTD